jgi:TonB family protein
VPLAKQMTELSKLIQKTFLGRGIIKPTIQSIYRVWLDTLPAEAKPFVQFKVSADGSVSMLNVVESSGNKAFDEAAQKAITTVHLLPFAQNIPLRWITFQSHFLVNVKCGELPMMPRS